MAADIEQSRTAPHQTKGQGAVQSDADVLGREEFREAHARDLAIERDHQTVDP